MEKELRVGDVVVVDLGEKFRNTIIEAIYDGSIDVFEDGTQILHKVKPTKILTPKCAWADSAIGQNIGVEREQISLIN